MNRLVLVTAALGFTLILSMTAVPGAVVGQDTTAERSFDTEAPGPGENVTVTTTINLVESTEVNFVDAFDPAFASADLISITANDEEVPTLLADAVGDSVVLLTEAVGPGTLTVAYQVEVPPDATPGEEYTFDSAVELNGEMTPVAGDSTLTVGGADAASFAVSIDTSGSAVVGESLTAEYTVENTGAAEETQDIVFSADGSQVGTVSATLAEGETTTGTFEYTPSADGEIELAVASDDTTATSTLTVESSPDDGGDDGTGNGSNNGTDDNDDGDGDDANNGDGNSGDGSGPGFGLLGAVLSTVLLTGYGVSRRRTREA